MIDYPLVNDELALLWMVNMGCIDMNAWYSRVDKPDRPGLRPLRPRSLGRRRLQGDRPGRPPRPGGPRGGRSPRVPEDERLRRHPRARPARPPLHVRGHPPLCRGDRGCAGKAHPGLVTTEWTKAKRRGVLIDANQNGEGKTIASAYSVRPRPGAPVSTPLRWDEVTEDLDPLDFTMDLVLARVERYGDLFEPVLKERQSLTRALKTIT